MSDAAVEGAAVEEPAAEGPEADSEKTETEEEAEAEVEEVSEADSQAAYLVDFPPRFNMHRFLARHIMGLVRAAADRPSLRLEDVSGGQASLDRMVERTIARFAEDDPNPGFRVWVQSLEGDGDEQEEIQYPIHVR